MGNTARSIWVATVARIDVRTLQVPEPREDAPAVGERLEHRRDMRAPIGSSVVACIRGGTNRVRPAWRTWDRGLWSLIS
jgi:hypothetical protein